MTRHAIVYLAPFEAGAHAGPDTVDPGPGIEVLSTVRDADGLARSGLAEALRRIAAGEAGVLVVARLGSVAGSLEEIVALLDWLAAVGAELVALDVGLDTGSAASRRGVGLLREVAAWPGRLPAGRRPRGRPGIAVSAPELSRRILAMRERGLSLQAIADDLNADGVATRRGGVRWRPSSVQAALGYRRPRPPVAGLPPPPPRSDDPHQARGSGRPPPPPKPNRQRGRP